MSAEVLAYARDRDPRFKTVPDDELTLYIGDRAPEFLQDPDFRKVYEARKQQAANTADTARATSATGIVKDAVDLPGWKKALTEGSREDWGRAWDLANQGMDRLVSAPLDAVGNVGGAALNKVGDLLAGDVKAITGLTPLDPAGPVATGLQEGARTVPAIAGAMALQGMGVPAPVAFAIPPAAAAYEHTGDLSAAIQAGSVAAVIPGVMHAGKRASATILEKLVEKGALSAEAAVPQKVAEMLGGQGAVQVFLEGMNLPAYAAMDPEQRRDAILRNVVANTAFMAMDVPGLIDGSPSVMQSGNRGLRAADALRRIQRDPEVLAGLQAVADAAVANPLREVLQDNPLTTRKAPLGEVPQPPRATEPSPLADINWRDQPADAAPPDNRVATADASDTRRPAAAGEGAETITGFNERIGSEMPAEREERPNPPRRRAPRTEQVFGAERPRDLIDEIQDAFGKVNLAEIRRLEPNFKPAGAARRLFAADSGHPADVVAEAMARSGFYKGDPARVGDFAYAILEAAAARKGNRKASAAANQEIREQAKQYDAFQSKVIAGRRPKKEQANVEQVSVSELVEGDQFTVQGQKFKVKEMEWDPDTESLVSVTLKDGPKFGVQRIEGSDAEVIHIDKESFVPKPGSRSTDFLNPEDLAGAADDTANASPAEGDGFNLESVTKEQLDAEEAARTRKAKADAQREELARRAEAPLTGNSADVGQGALFNADADLFSGPAAQHSQAHGTKAQAYPGGPLGEAPVSPADNPGFSRFPMELPEAVRFARDLAGGVYPRLRDKMRLMGGRALGVFRHNDAAGKASIEIRRDIFDLPPSERQRLLEEARAYAKAVGKTETEITEITRERFEFLKREAFKENPLMALKVLWHEIGHWVDWLPDHMIGGRGNLFGRLASLKGYLRHTLPEGPDVPDRPITEAQRAKLKREAEAELRAELGPIEEIVRTILVEEPEFRVTGVTPDDVKQLFGMDAREKMPELYRWFAEQPAEAKKEIVRAAMKGVVDARVAALGKRELIGTKKVERTVREKVGREPTREEIRERFQKMLREELQRRRMIELDQIKKEIEPMIAWWRGTDQMEEYFRPSAEMYAEAFSIFANNPGALAKRAPTYYRVLTNYLSRKPEVSKLYREIQDSIDAGTIMRDRVEDLRRSWRVDDAQSMERAASKERISLRDYLDNVSYYFNDRLGPVYRIAKKAGAQGDDLREAAGNYRYRASEHERLLSRVNREVVEPLATAGIDRVMLAEYMFHKHVAESRFVKDGDTGEIRMIGNPMGWAPKNSLERLAEMKSQLGPDGFARVEAAQKRFRQIYEEQVVDLIRRSGMASPELMKAIEDRTFYATFSKAKGEAAIDGIEQLLQDSFGPDVSAKIYRQVGNLAEIKNPFTATVMKALSLTSAAYRNIVKRETVKAMIEHDASNIKESKVMWTGKRSVPVVLNQGKVRTLVYLDHGQVKAYDVPKAVAESVHGGPVIDNLLALGVMKAMGVQKALFTQWNYAFWPVAFAKDAFAWQLQMPGWNSLEYAKRIGPALKAAADAWGGRKASPLADEALRRKMIISRHDSRGILSSASDEFDLAVASYGLDPVKWGESDRKVSMLIRAWNAYREVGQITERAQKIAGMTYLDAKFPEMPEWQKQEMVRERAGSPDFLRRGASAGVVDFFMMFYNPVKEGVRSAVKSAAENPISFASKGVTAVAVPAVFQAMAARGLLGDEIKEKFDSVSDYDLTNYWILPMGWANRERKKVAYIRVPLPEPAKLIHGGVISALTGRGPGFLSQVGGQIPGLNPLLTVAGMWGTYLISGQNPYDSFHGRALLSPDVFAAGGEPAVEDMLRQTWNSLGGGIIAQLQGRPLGEPDPDQVEKFLRLPVVSGLIGKWIKISNRGIADQDRAAAAVPAREAAARRETVRVVVEKVLSDPPKPLTPSERLVMRHPDAMRYFHELRLKTAQSRASLQAQRLQRLPSKAEKAAAMQR